MKDKSFNKGKEMLMQHIWYHTEDHPSITNSGHPF